jgi:hypothetical protein
MRYARFVFMLLGIAVALSAADPFVGTWKLNPSKSKFKTGQPMKESTVTITEAGEDLDVKIEGMAADGTPMATHYTVPTAGGEGKVIESPYEAVSAKRLGTHRREIAYRKGGKVAFTVRSRVSADGKTLTANMKGTNPAGQLVDGTIVFEKQ